MTKKAVIILAEGFEDIETVTPIDILRRAGIDVTVAGLSEIKVRGARGTTVVADKLLGDAGSDFDLCVLPGGSGAAKLAASKTVGSLVMDMYSKGKVIAAICAAPALVLSPLGILKGKKATSFPGEKANMDKEAIYKEDSVVVDGNIITSRAPGTALLFSLAIVEKLAGRDTAEKIRKATLA